MGQTSSVRRDRGAEYTMEMVNARLVGADEILTVPTEPLSRANVDQSLLRVDVAALRMFVAGMNDDPPKWQCCWAWRWTEDAVTEIEGRLAKIEAERVNLAALLDVKRE